MSAAASKQADTRVRCTEGSNGGLDTDDAGKPGVPATSAPDESYEGRKHVRLASISPALNLYKPRKGGGGEEANGERYAALRVPIHR